MAALALDLADSGCDTKTSTEQIAARRHWMVFPLTIVSGRRQRVNGWDLVESVGGAPESESLSNGHPVCAWR